MRYEYRCLTCKQVTEAIRSIDARDNCPQCAGCGKPTRKIISLIKPVGVSRPYYDVNLETEITSNLHKKRVMKEQGVSEKFGKGWY